MELPKLEDLKVSGKKVLVRADLDVGDSVEDLERLKNLVPTLEYLVGKAERIIVIGHRGRPQGKVVENLSLRPVSRRLEQFLKKKWGEERVKRLSLYLMENLRFNPGEEANNEDYAKQLAKEGEVYVNEAFAASHRKHASIVALPRLLPHAAGLHFMEEVENLSRVFEKPERPILVIIGGAKKDKLALIEDLKKLADKILVGGRLPEEIPEANDEKLIVATLLPDKEEITIHSMERFEEEIKKAKTIVLSGPMGKFEEKGHRQGTERVFRAVADASAFKVAGGGETQKAVLMFGLEKKFDWRSVAGGAMLEFLAKRTLPGIEALLH